MGEYADDYFRRVTGQKFGFDPGSMDSDKRRPEVKKVACKICQRRVKEVGLADHMRDAHGEAAKPAAEKAKLTKQERQGFNDWKNSP